MKFTIIIILIIINLIKFIDNKNYDADWSSLDSRPLPDWYDNDKIGLFIHWGVYSVPSFNSEWFWYQWKTQKNTDSVKFIEKNYSPFITYENFAKDFTLDLFNTKEWLELIRKSGIRYLVLTSKHHEGYTLFSTNYSFNWNAMDIGPKRDIVNELSQEIKNYNLQLSNKNDEIKFGLYYSLFEWYNPLYLLDKNNKYHTQNYIQTKLSLQLKELIEKYQPLILWSDGEWEAADDYWQSKKFLQWLYNNSTVRDEIVVNDRWGNNTLCKHGGYLTCSDKYNPGKLQSRKWENAMTINKKSWGYRRNSNLNDFLTIQELINQIVRTISFGGNILINIGPTKSGKINPIFEERLIQMGNWLKINNESIYYTKPWLYQNDFLTKSVYYTQSKLNENFIYAIQLGYPMDSKITLGNINFNKIKSIELLGTDKKIQSSSNNDNHTVINFPNLNPNDKPCYAFVFKIFYLN